MGPASPARAISAALLLAVVAPAALPALSEAAPTVSGRAGLTGLPYMLEGSVLETGLLRVQGRLAYVRADGVDGGWLMLPLAACWGASDGLEIGASLPLYLDDTATDGEPLGDISAGCSWLFETARGGTGLILRGGLSLPTGSEGRDPGTEVFAGVGTGTTFRLFRLHASGMYVVNGGRNPFDSSLSDYARFSMGGTSFLSEDIRVAAGMSGTTLGELGLSGSMELYPLEELALIWTAGAGLSGGREYWMSLGGSWTLSGMGP